MNVDAESGRPVEGFVQMPYLRAYSHGPTSHEVLANSSRNGMSTFSPVEAGSTGIPNELCDPLRHEVE